MMSRSFRIAGLVLGVVLVASCVDSPDTFPSTTSMSAPTTTSTSVAGFEWPVVTGYESMHWPSGPVSGVPLSFPDPMYCGCSLVTLDDGRVLMWGWGYGIGRAIWIWDPETRQWSETGSPIQDWWDTLLMDDGRVLAWNYENLEIYDPVSGSSHQVDLPRSVTLSGFGPVATGMSDGRVFLATSPLSGAVFDPVTEEFTSVGSSPVPTDVTEVVALDDGRVLILSYLTASIYDPVTDQFDHLDPVIPLERGIAVARLHDGRVLITGGQTWDGTRDLGSSDVQIFDPATDRFIAARSMLDPRSDHSAVTMPDGRVLIIGGAEGRVELFEPETGLFVPAPELYLPRDRPVVALLGDGSLLVVGGDDAAATTSDGFNVDRTTWRTAELYHPLFGSIESLEPELSGLTLSLVPDIDWRRIEERPTGDLSLELDVPPGALNGLAFAYAVWEPIQMGSPELTGIRWKGLDDRQWGGGDPVERPLPTGCEDGCVIREAMYDSTSARHFKGLHVHLQYQGEIPDEAAQITMTIVDG